jgi:hypothetical protein
VTGHRFIVGAERDGELVGCAVAGRPSARLLPQYDEIEVTRLCTDESRNVCSFLYSRCSRIAQELGFRRIWTAILEDETGHSLKTAGWKFEYMTKTDAKGWDRPSRRREIRNPGKKQIWTPGWCWRLPEQVSAERRTLPEISQEELDSLAMAGDHKFREAR